MNGKVKKNRVLQVEQSVNRIAKFLDSLETNTVDEIYFYNGVETAMSMLEDRQPVYKDAPKTPTTPKKITLKQKINFYLAYFRFYSKKDKTQ